MRASDIGAVSAPGAWPSPPSTWSFSVLREVESCPRRWALRASEYPTVWDGTGYPPLLSVKALEGQVIHETVKKIAAALSEGGCQSVREAASVEVLRALGGFTKVLNEVMEQVVGRHRGNPRMERVQEQVGAELLRAVPIMRQQVQSHLLHVDLVPRHSSLQPGDRRDAQAPLGNGSYSEIRLHSAPLNWVGIVDMLEVRDGKCAIWEFKSGTPDEKHQEQLRSYALLWIDDAVRNPAGFPAEKLILSYAERRLELAPLGAEALAALRDELKGRISAAAEASSEIPPPARPDPEVCRFCDVRHLCMEYWATMPTWKGSGDIAGGFGDVEVRVGSKRGPRSWDAVIVTSAWLPPLSPAVLTLSTTGDPSASGVASDLRARMLNVRLLQQPSDTEGPPLVCINTHSEVFRIG